MTKLELAHMIEAHQNYTGEYQSKRYYKYSCMYEINQLMKKKKNELVDMFIEYYGYEPN